MAAVSSETIIRILRGRVVRQLSAVMAVALALLVRIALARQSITLPTYITFYPAVILAALLGGMWTGILAMALSALMVDYWVLEPVGQFSIHSTSDIVAMVIFCFSGVSISAVTELYRRSHEKLAAFKLQEAVQNERRKAEEERNLTESIRAERRRFLDVLETLPTMISLLTPDHRIAFANRSFREKFGSCQDEYCFETRFGRSTPCEFCESYIVLETGQPHRWEVILPDGSLMDAYDYPFADLDGSSLILEMNIDITERKRAERELKEHRDHLEELIAERTRQLRIANMQLETDIGERKRVEQALETTLQRFYAILSNLSSGVMLVTNEGRIEFANEAFCSLFDLKESPADLITSFDSERVIARVDAAYADQGQAALRIREILSQGQAVSSEEVALRNGGVCLRDFAPLTVDGRSYGRMWVHTDITELKRKEEALRESEEVLGLFAEHAPAALAMFDREMRYLNASRRWRADYGLGDRDLRGVSHYEAFPEIPEQWKEAHRRGLAGEVLTGDDDRFERADGSAQWIRWEIRPWCHADGEVGGIVIFTEDTTRRKAAEAALLRNEKLALQREQLQALAKRLQQAREEERKKVARDLHDQIGQILTAIKMDMAWAVRHLPGAQNEVRDRLKGSIELVNDGVRSVRAICSGLRPGILDDLGLAAAIEWQAREFAARSGIACKVSIPSSEMRLGGDLSTAIFRIFQECLTNITRHAEAQSVSALLSTQDEDLLLVVRDDGKGFDESQVAASLGVLGMKERAKACDGDVQVSSSPGKGTTVTVRVPLRASIVDREDHAHSDRR